MFCFFLFHGPNFSKVSSLTNDFKAKIEKLKMAVERGANELRSDIETYVQIEPTNIN